MADDGMCYDRSAIRTWLQSESTSPMTGLPLPQHRLLTCRPLRCAIEAAMRQGLIDDEDLVESWTDDQTDRLSDALSGGGVGVAAAAAAAAAAVPDWGTAAAALECGAKATPAEFHVAVAVTAGQPLEAGSQAFRVLATIVEHVTSSTFVGHLGTLQRMVRARLRRREDAAGRMGVAVRKWYTRRTTAATRVCAMVRGVKFRALLPVARRVLRDIVLLRTHRRRAVKALERLDRDWEEKQSRGYRLPGPTLRTTAAGGTGVGSAATARAVGQGTATAAAVGAPRSRAANTVAQYEVHITRTPLGLGIHEEDRLVKVSGAMTGDEVTSQGVQCGDILLKVSQYKVCGLPHALPLTHTTSLPVVSYPPTLILSHPAPILSSCALYRSEIVGSNICNGTRSWPPWARRPLP